MVGYIDSSIALRHILLGAVEIKHALSCGRLISSEIMEIECRRVILRCRMQGELTDDSVVSAIERLEILLKSVSLLELSRGIKKRAMQAFPVIIKTLDALHLASALAFIETWPHESLLVFSHDSCMNRCAKALGFVTPLHA